jgi:arsenite methyltransferase
MEKHSKDKLREVVRENYKNVALADSGCGCNSTDCGSPTIEPGDLDSLSLVLGYSEKEFEDVPEGSNMGLGCGNPQAIASLKPGETVLDLGSGGGFDAFLAAKTVGDSGMVIGVDMTPEMVSKARQNALKGKYSNTDFRLGEIEYLPVPDSSVDVIISNCVINLSPEKQKVFNEAYRVLKIGGRLAISDVVSSIELGEEIKNDMALYSGCISGASSIEDLRSMLRSSGFEDIRIDPKDESREFIKDWAPGMGVENYVVSANIEAIKK